jgi:hypothetical protein
MISLRGFIGIPDSMRRLHKFAYHALRESHIISGLLAVGLVWAPGISQHGELHGPLRAALPQASHLNPVSSHLLIGSDHEVVTFSCRPHRIFIVANLTALYELHNLFSGRFLSVERNGSWPERTEETHEEDLVRIVCPPAVTDRAPHKSEPLAYETSSSVFSSFESPKAKNNYGKK